MSITSYFYSIYVNDKRKKWSDQIKFVLQNSSFNATEKLKQIEETVKEMDNYSFEEHLLKSVLGK
jgi:hypothetical protein